MAKIGYLYLHKGEWEGRRLLSKQWVDRVFDPQVAVPYDSLRYANGWWTVPKLRALVAVGLLGQYIVVLPDLDIITVVTGRGGAPVSRVIGYLADAARSSSSIASNEVAASRLRDRVAGAAIEKATPVKPVSKMAQSVSGKTYQFGRNAIQLKSLRLDLLAADPRYQAEYYSRDGGSDLVVNVPLGLHGKFGVRPIQELDELRGVKAEWIRENVLLLTYRSIQEGLVVNIELVFGDHGVEVVTEDNRGFRLRLTGTAAE
ncbi:MAG: hypothetical protein ABI702_26360 [Burkholderiales bacterium]